MIVDTETNQKPTLLKFLFLFLLAFLSHGLYAQTAVDCSINTNCTNEFCNYPKESAPGLKNGVEKGCNCFNNYDDDGDGLIDKQDLQCAQYYGLAFVGDEGDCSLDAPAGSPFSSMAAPIVSGQNTADTQSKVSVGDIDYDGVPDVIITSKWNSEVRVVATKAHTVGGVTYAPGDIKSDYKTTGQGAKIFSGTGGCDPKNLLFEHENLIANIDDTGPAEIFTIVSNRGGNPSTPPTCFFLLSLRYAAGDLIPMYDAVALGPNRPGVFGVADMDGDGKAEIYMRDRIYAAETGVLLATGNGNWDLDITSGPVAVDVIKGDNGKMELVCGTKIYSIPNLSNRTPATPANLTLSRDMNTLTANKCFVKLATDPVEYGEDTHSMCSVADVDGDGNVDVIISGALNSPVGKTAVFYWNVTSGTVSHFVVPDPVYPDGWPWGTGRVNLLDSDDDGFLDLFFVAGSTLFRVETVGTTFAADINTNAATYSANVTTRTINDSRSGVLTVTIYDFNNDGKFELVYRDSQELVVVDAVSLGTLTAPPPAKYWSATCQSHTYTEGPIIADVNGDGATDICVACNRNNSFGINDPIQQQALGEVRLFFSQNNSWLPTRKVWNQPGYFVVNINDDLSLPFPQYDQTLTFGSGTCSNGLVGPQRPLNVYLNQLPYITASGCPVFPSPDLTYFGDDPTTPGVDTNGDGSYTPTIIVTPPICGNNEVTVRFNLINSGLLPITASVPVAFYNGNPTLGPGSSTFLYTTTLNVSLPVGVTTLTAPVTFNGPGSAFDLYIVLNNTGFPVAAGGKSSTDCDLANNIELIRVTPTPFTATAALVRDNVVCVPTDANGEVRVNQIFKGATAVTDWSVYNFQWYTGGAATVGPATLIPGATLYNLQGRTAGSYSVVVTHKTIGCSSAPVTAIVGESQLFVDYDLNKISDQTQCTPLNGSIQADFKGADLTGVSIVWRDANSNEIIDTQVTSLSGLKGDVTYQLSVSRGGCASSKIVSLLAPVIPSGQAQTIRDVMNCINPQSGKVSAFAYLPGSGIADPDTTSYRFTWYNSSNGVRGSLIPNQPVNGPSAWGLPIGFYEVVITDIRTNCTSIDPIAPVEITEGFTLPVATMQRIRPQTSCDPAFSNAALQAIVTENGVPAADQSQYHFYWYQGQNTLTRLQDNTNTIIDNPLLDNVQGGVKGGGQSYTVQVIHKITGCAAIADTTAAENINYPVVSLTKTDNEICPNDLNIAYNGDVASTVQFAALPVSDFTNYTFNWYTGTNVLEANRIPNATALREILNLSGGHITLQVEETALRCKSTPVSIQVLDLLTYPVVVPGVIGSANCTNPPVPDGKALVTTVDNIAVPATGILAPYAFKWYTGTSVTPGNETSGVNNLGFIDKIQGSNDHTLANFTVQITNDKGCSSNLTIHVPDNKILPALSLTPTPNTNCAEGNGLLFTGKVDAVVTNQIGSINDYSFTWSNATLGTRANLVGAPGTIWDKIAAGDYTVKVTHTVTGCESPVSLATVTNITELPVINAFASGSTNCLPTPGNGSVKVISMDGSPTEIAGVPDPAILGNYAFEWYQGLTATGTPITTVYNTPSTLQGAVDANYIVKVTKLSNNCVNTFPVIVPDLSAKPVITLGQDPNTNCENFNGAAYVTGISYKGAPYANAANIDYAWFDGSGTTTPRNPQVDNVRIDNLNGQLFYSATVTMLAEGCTSDFVAIEVQNNLTIPTVSTSVNGSQNCVGGTADGSAAVTGILPAGTYEHRWYAGSVAGAPGTEINSGLTDVDIDGKQGAPDAFFHVDVKNTTTGCRGNATVLIPDISQIPVINPLTPITNKNCLPLGPNGEVDFNGFTYRGAVVPAPYTGFTFEWVSTAGPLTETTDGLINKAADQYTLQITHVIHNCVSDPVSAVVVDELVYPLINTFPTPQTSCDPAAPNGQIVANVGPGNVVTGYSFVWTNSLNAVIPETAVDGTTTRTLPSEDYTVTVTDNINGCVSMTSLLLPDQITFPTLTYNGVSPNSRCDTPNGQVTPVVGLISQPGNEDFSLFYVKTIAGNTYPNDRNDIETSPTLDRGNYSSTTSLIVPPVTGLRPGYLTGFVRDNFTKCVSTVETIEITDATLLVTYQFIDDVHAGLCSPGGGGGIDVQITGGVGPLTYQWYNATPSNTNINFYDNPPNMGAAPVINPNTSEEDLGNPAGNPVGGVSAGIYTLVVFDGGNGCGAYFIETVPLIESPEFNITAVDNTHCTVPNGSISVQVAQTDPTTGPFSLKFYQGNGPSGIVIPGFGEVCDQAGDEDGDGLVNAADPDCGQSNFTTTIPNLLEGEYFVELIDYTPQNRDCPQGKGQILLKKVFSPILSAELFKANTSCEPGNSGDGTIRLTATPNSKDTSTPDYQVYNITPAPVGPSILPLALVPSVQSGDLTGFGPNSYTINMRDIGTGCESVTSISIPDQPAVPDDIDASVTPDTYCFPKSNGGITITNVSPGIVTDYDYSWYDDADVSTATALYTGPEAIYNSTSTGWKTGAVTGAGNGDHTYYVRGIKRVGDGIGCPTPVLMRVVTDAHRTPVAQVITRPNTSCDDLVGEGFIQVTANTTSPDPLVQNSLYTYQLDATPVVTGQTGSTPFQYGDLTDQNGTPYILVTTNEESACLTQNSITILPSKFSFNIISNTVQHQLICDPFGNITITGIQLDRSLTGEPTINYNAALSADFDFTWTLNASAPLADNTNTPIVTEALVTGTGAGQYAAMGAGSYFVTAKRKSTVPGAGCITPPYRVDVFDQHVNPVVALTAFSNTSCSTLVFEGSIQVGITDASVIPGPFSYEYTWTPPAGTTVPVGTNINDGDKIGTDGDGDNPTGLIDGNYALQVENTQTGCLVNAATTIIKNETPVFLANATPLPQEFCSNSGSIEVTDVEVQYLYPTIRVEPAPLSDFIYTWNRDGVQVLQDASVFLNNANYADISAGTYFVTATRNISSDNGPGLGCSSAPFRVDILNRISFPNITVDAFANTACSDDPDYFEGSARLNVTETGAGAGATYEYTWSANDPLNTSTVLTLVPKPTGTGNGDLQGGLRDDVYTIDVLNTVSSCVVTAQTQIVKTTLPVIIAQADTDPKMICNPDGSAFVQQVNVSGVPDINFNNFDFQWSEETVGNLINPTNPVNPGTQRGLVRIDDVNWTTITDNSLTYFVAVRMREDAVNADLTPARGRGCVSPPVRVVIQDLSVDPTVTFVPTQNTSCNDLAPNGSIIGTAADLDGLPYTYTFNWTYNGTLPATTLPYSAGVDNGFTRAPEGDYTLLLINEDTGCEITRNITVDLNESASYPNIIEVIPTSPIDCNNSGSAEVTRIFIGNNSGAEIPGTDARFTYTWYTAYTNAATNTPIAGQIEETVTNRGPGTYFVTVMDTFEDRNCPSGPNQVTIDDPIENYPVIAISQSLPQISCRPGEGTAALVASADGITGVPYTFTWYSGLDATGTELIINNTLSNVDEGSYSVKAYNSVTNCTSQEYYIIEDNSDLFYPQMMIATGPRTNCLTPDGSLGVREIGYPLLNTTNPALPGFYNFAPNYSADYILGAATTVDPNFNNDMPPGAGFDQSTNRFWEAELLNSGDTYTVKITDENTGCFIIRDILIPDQRQDPLIDVIVENPLINCYEDRQNGQITATADNGQVTGYEFTWYKGENPLPAMQIFTGDKLIGAGETPDNTALRFTVKVVRTATGCEATESVTLPDSRIDSATPTAYTVQDDSRCDSDDGWVTAHVDNVTFTHNFFWFDGDIAAPVASAANETLPDYTGLGENWYTVIAQDRETGCFSPPVKTFVKDISVIPGLIFKTTASYCEDVPTDLGGGKGNGTIELTLDPADVISDNISWTKEETLEDAGVGNYVTGLFPGFYSVDVITTKGCVTNGRVEVPTDIRSYNLITQNRDNKNDKFVIDCISRFPNNNVKIFNRSGVLVYEANNYDNDGVVFEGIGKNGIYMVGNELPVGTYFYIIDKGDGSKPKTGYLELVR